MSIYKIAVLYYKCYMLYKMIFKLHKLPIHYTMLYYIPYYTTLHILHTVV